LYFVHRAEERMMSIRRLIAKPSGGLFYYIFFGKAVNYEAILMVETKVTDQYTLLVDFSFISTE